MDERVRGDARPFYMISVRHEAVCTQTRVCEPEVEQPWAEMVPEALGPAGKEGASWVEVEEVVAKEVLLEDHASSVASDHLTTQSPTHNPCSAGTNFIYTGL